MRTYGTQNIVLQPCYDTTGELMLWPYLELKYGGGGGGDVVKM